MSADLQADTLIIGTGQAAVPLAMKLVAAGQRVFIFERSAVGGTCVNVGCTPTKTMIASARAAHVARTAARLGVHVGEVRVDFPAVVARKNQMVERWRAGSEKRLASKPELLTLVRAHARFVDAHTVEADGKRYTGKRVVIDVGARPQVPTLPGLAGVPFLDNHSVMDLPALPSHLLVLGGGAIGLEFAQAFLRFGSKVTLLERGPQLLSSQDEDVGKALVQALRGEGMTLELGAKVASVSSKAGAVELGLEDGRVLSGSHVLVATGRAPNTQDLGCERAGIELDAHGFIKVGERFETNVAGVFAVGDVTGEPQYTHVAWDDHRLLAAHLLGNSAPRDRSSRHFPWAVFVDPQVAGVGLSEKAARAKGIPYELARYEVSHVARNIEVDETAGLLKILVDPRDEKILGATFMGAEAAELIHEVIVLMEAGASARAIVTSEAVHPAYAEGVQSALMTLPRFS